VLGRKEKTPRTKKKKSLLFPGEKDLCSEAKKRAVSLERKGGAHATDVPKSGNQSLRGKEHKNKGKIVERGQLVEGWE